ncbi:MAG: C-GCAxxG-C-C family protein [Oscillospiraceae bacterium]
MEQFIENRFFCPKAAKIKEYFFCGGLNCAESTMRFLIQEFGLNSGPELIKAMSGFGGGMQRGLTCGAVTAAVAAIGLELGRVGPDMDRQPSADAVASFLQYFEDKFGSISCSELIAGYESKSAEMYEHCEEYIVAAAGYISEHLNLNGTNKVNEKI